MTTTVKKPADPILTRSALIEQARPSPCFKPELRAKILDGSKTQTRRIAEPLNNPLPSNAGRTFRLIDGMVYASLADREITADGRTVWGAPVVQGRWCEVRVGAGRNAEGNPYHPPHGQPGTIWYLREPIKHRRLSVDDPPKGWAHYSDDDEPVPGANGEPIRWRWQRDSLPQIHLPKQLARHFVRVTDVRVERLQAISEADAIAEGFDQQGCAQAFDAAAGKVKTRGARWLEDEEGNDPDFLTYCDQCADRLAVGGLVVRGSDVAEETDGPAYCEECHAPINVSLTAYGVERELLLECPGDDDRTRYPVKGADARIVWELATGMGDLRDQHLGRLAQIGFATLWNQMHGPDAWQRNDWVFVYTFERLEVHP